MMVMLANHSSPPVHFWAGKYPGKVGWLIGPSGKTKTKLREWLPFALDNDAFTAWEQGTIWSESAYFDFLEWVASQDFRPRWATVPDVVADKKGTLQSWNKYADRVAGYGWPLAFVAQDGMNPRDVPDSAEVVFLGGSYRWKWRNAETFAGEFPRLHVGRVNTLARLRRCEELGVESVDGTGWFRRPEGEFFKLEDFFSGKPDSQMMLGGMR